MPFLSSSTLCTSHGNGWPTVSSVCLHGWRAREGSESGPSSLNKLDFGCIPDLKDLVTQPSMRSVIVEMVVSCVLGSGLGLRPVLCRVGVAGQPELSCVCFSWLEGDPP